MDEHQVHAVARFVLRALLVCAAGLILLVIGASTAQADDAPPEDRPEDRPAAPVVRPVASLADRATDSLREVGARTPAAQPVTDTVAEAADRTAGDVVGRVDDLVHRATPDVVEDVVEDVVKDVVAPVLPAEETDTPDDAEESPAQSAPAGQQGPAASAVRSSPDRDVRNLHRAAEVRALPVASPAPTSESAPATQYADRKHAPNPFTAILELGAVSGAPGSGSGAAGASTPMATLTHAATIAAGARPGVLRDRDDRLPRTLPRTPSWSPD